MRPSKARRNSSPYSGARLFISCHSMIIKYFTCRVNGPLFDPGTLQPQPEMRTWQIEKEPPGLEGRPTCSDCRRRLAAVELRAGYGSNAGDCGHSAEARQLALSAYTVEILDV